MSMPERIVVLCKGRSLDPILEGTIKAHGYELTHIASAGDLHSVADSESGAPVALVLNADSHSDVRALLHDVDERVPGAKLLVLAPDGKDGVDETIGKAWEGDRIAWILGDPESKQSTWQIHRFLQRDGYFRASDIEPGGAGGAFFLDRAHGTDRRQEREAKQVVTFISDLSNFTELDPMVKEALRRCLDVLHCEAGSVYLWDERRKLLVLQAAEGPEQDKRLGLRQELGEGLAGWVAEVGEPILITDTRRVPKLRGRACRRYSDFSCLATPIAHGDQLFGVMCLTMRKGQRPFEPDDLFLARNLSRKLGSLIRPLSLMCDLHDVNERLRGLFRAFSGLLVEKDSQAAEMRALSYDILEGIPVAVIAYDRRLRVRCSNTAAQNLFGSDLDHDHIPLEELLDVDHTEWQNKLSRVVEQAEEFRAQRVVLRRDDQSRVIDVQGLPLHDSEGATVGGILTVQDVTEDVELEEKLSSAEQLALIGKIAAKVAHELNNPLDGILRFLNLALRYVNDKPEQAESYLNECREGLLRMSNILSQLLVFSRSFREPERPVSVSRIIRECLVLYEERARSTNTQISIEIPPDLPVCPSPAIFEAVGNVIKNALDVMGENGKLTVRASHEDSLVKITISDTGPGVPEEIREKIFEPFFTTKKDAKGTGLGLAVCRDTLNRIGGKIELRPSELGATFEITVPVNEPQE